MVKLLTMCFPQTTSHNTLVFLLRSPPGCLWFTPEWLRWVWTFPWSNRLDQKKRWEQKQKYCVLTLNSYELEHTSMCVCICIYTVYVYYIVYIYIYMTYLSAPLFLLVLNQCVLQFCENPHDVSVRNISCHRWKKIHLLQPFMAGVSPLRTPSRLRQMSCWTLTENSHTKTPFFEVRCFCFSAFCAVS